MIQHGIERSITATQTASVPVPHQNTEGIRNPFMDNHGRHIRYLRLSITDRCNLRCLYCMPEEGVQWTPHEEIMRYEEFLRIIRICAGRGVDKVRLTGGEPLVKKGFVEFVSIVANIPGIADLSLTTNAVLLDAMAGPLKDSGISRVNISLDTLNRGKFAYITRTDAFDRVMAGIAAARSSGLGIKINMVAIRGFNDDEIKAFADLTLQDPLEVRFIELMPVGCAGRLGPSRVITAREIRKEIMHAYGPLEVLPSGLGPASVYRIPGARGTLGFIEPVSESSFCSRCNRIRISASGQLRPCLIADDHLDLKGPLRQGLTDEQLEELIQTGVRLKPRRGMNPGTGCTTMMSAIGG